MVYMDILTILMTHTIQLFNLYKTQVFNSEIQSKQRKKQIERKALVSNALF